MLSSENFFFEQQRPRRFQHRRLRKIDDTLSNFGSGGEKRENYLTFTKSNWDNESALTGVRSIKRPPTATGGRRPGTARRVSVNEVPSILPSIDPTGPRLVALPKEPIIPEAVEVRSVLSEKKREFLEEVEVKLQSQEKERPAHNWKFTEAKFVSLSILSRLSELIYDNFEASLPESLVEDLMRSHQDLTADVIPEKREWQTDCYLDFRTKNKQPFLTSLPEEPQTQTELEAAVEKVAKKSVEAEKEKAKSKKVRMSRETIKHKQKSPERPQTARSILSNISFKSDDVMGESVTDDDGRESRVMEYDVLPADLRPGILHYRQESLVPTMKRTTAKTRLEKFQMQKKEIEKKATTSSKAIVVKLVSRII